MATEGGRIPLPLAVGVDCSHPRPLGVDHSHPQWPDLFFFFFWLVHQRQIWPLMVAGSLPLAVGVDRGHPQWPDLSIFFCSPGKSSEVCGGWRWVAASVAGGGRRVAVGGGVRRQRWAVGYLFGCLIC
jgi:hypothetical protein